MDDMTRYETARQCAQKFHPPSGDEITRTISGELSYLLAGQGIATDIAQMVSRELSGLLAGQGIATDIAEAMAKSKKCNIPQVALCLFKDGESWCCVFGDFVDLQESPAGFGETFDDAISDLSKKKGL